MGFFDPDIDKLVKNKDIKELIKAMMHKKRELRQSAGRALGKFRGSAQRLEICMSLTQLIKECDWFRSNDIVQGLGSMRCRIATDTICDLIYIALRDYEMYRVQETSAILRGQQIKMNTDTDSLPTAPSEVYSQFIRSAVTALGNIGDPEAKDTLKAVMKNKNMNREMVKNALYKIEN